MINILVNKKGDLITELTIEGHAEFADKGKDIVCAGISAISQGSLNAINELTGIKPDYKIDDSGYLNVKYRNDNDSQIIARVTLIQLKTVEEAYPKQVKITEL